MEMKADQASNTTRFPYSQIPHVMPQIMRISGNAKLTYYSLASHADRSSGQCFPAVETIARASGMSVRSVQKALKELEQRHIITIERRNRDTNIFTVLDPSLWKLTDEEQAALDKQGDGYRSPGSAYNKGDTLTPKGATISPKGATISPSRVQLFHPNKNQFNKNHLTRITELEIQPPSSPPGGFVSFMLAYPKGSHEQQALEEWMKLDPDEALASHIVACVGRAQSSEQWKKGMIPYAYKYLRDQCWKDDHPLFAPAATGPPAGGWSFDVKTKTYEQLTDGKWTKHPRSDVPEHVIDRFEVHQDTPFARRPAAEADGTKVTP
jgi:DNA-binding transcriptional ArsR family regulator